MKKIILLAAFLPSFYFSQVKTDLEVFGNSRGSVFEVTNRSFKSYSGIDGSPYIDEAFHPITIEGYSKSLPSVRYNAYEDEMEFMAGDELNYVIKQNDLRLIYKDSGRVYILTNYLFDNKPIKGYLIELLGKGKYKLYKREKVQIVEYNNNTTNTYLKDKNPYFEKDKDIYLINDNGDYKRLPKNVKDLIVLLHIENTKAVLDYAKENNINLKNESDQIKLFEFINNL